MGEWGVSRFSVEKNFSDSAEKFRGCGESFRVSFISGIDKVWIRGGGGRQYQDFPSKIFCLTVPKDFVREPFRVSLISGMEKIFCFGGLCHDIRFSVASFLSHSAEKIRR